MNHADDRVVRPNLEQLISDPTMRDQFEEQLGAVEAGSLLRCFRHAAGLTQQDVAERLHMSLAKVDQIKGAGDRGGPTYAVMVKFARACGFDLTQLVMKAVLPQDAYGEML
jgi:hypothetical protein